MDNILIRNIRNDIKNARFSNEMEVNKEIDRYISELLEARQRLVSGFRLLAGCTHSFKPTIYMVQRRVVGYVTVYERVCKDCGYIETFTQKDNELLPDWTSGATEAYYNNNI